LFLKTLILTWLLAANRLERRANAGVFAVIPVLARESKFHSGLPIAFVGGTIAG
jgi:hypothetical protein